MHRVYIMPLQATDWTWEPNLGRRQQGFGEIQEKRHSEYHYNNGYQATNRSGQSDVTETSRGQRRDCEVERIGIVGDLIVVRFLRLVDNSSHYENEHGEVCDRKDDFLVLSKERAVSAKPRCHLNIA